MIDLANQVAQNWWSWMGAMLWQASLLILLVSLIDLMIGRWAWPQVRYALWFLILIKLLIPPTWSLSSSVVTNTRPWAQQRIERILVQDRSASPLGVLPSIGDEVVAARPVTGDAAEPVVEPAAAGPVWQLYAMAIWILGMLAFAAMLVTRINKLRRWHQAQRAKKTIPVWFHELLVQTADRIKLGRLPAIVFSKEAVTPAVYGIFRPVLLLPENYTESLSREDAEHVLLHELAHLKRGDLWLHALTLLLQIVYWFNPLLLWVSRQIKHVREMCCDLTIANLLRERSMKYRETLLNTAREMLTESLEPGMGLLGVFEEPFRLMARLRWLQKKTWLNRKWMAVTSCLVLAIAVPCLLPMAQAEQVMVVDAEATSEDTRQAATPYEPTAVRGDRIEEEVFYVKEITHAQDYFLLFDRGEGIASSNELWFGDRRAASIEGDQTVIVDLLEGTVTFMNHRDRTYVKAPHPLDMSSLLGEFQYRHPLKQVTGVVDALDGTRTILDRECREYEVSFWTVAGHRQVDYNTINVWASTDMPFDVNLFYELIDDKRKFANRDADYRAELHDLKGIQMALKMESGSFLAGRIWFTEVVEIASKTPPPGLWSIPEGYARKEQFTREDFF